MCGVEVTTEEDADGIVPLSAEESNENDLVFDLEIGTRSHWSLILLVGNLLDAFHKTHRHEITGVARSLQLWRLIPALSSPSW